MLKQAIKRLGAGALAAVLAVSGLGIAGADAQTVRAATVYQPKLAAGKATSAAINSNGELYLWGSHAKSMMGKGVTEDQTKPMLFMEDVVDVVLDNAYGAAITSSHDLYLWGKKNAVPKLIGSNIASVTITGTVLSMIDTKGGLSLATIDEDTGVVEEPRKVMDNVIDADVIISYGGEKNGFIGFTYAALTKNGDLYTWGPADYLGDGSTADRTTPVKIMEDVTAVEGSHDSVFAALKKDGSVYTWGAEHLAKLGNGKSGFGEYAKIPEKILENVKKIDGNSRNGGALTEDGSLYLWGQGLIIGKWSKDPKIPHFYTPEKFLENVTDFAIGEGHAMAIMSDGALYTWGEGSKGQLGDGTTEGRSDPKKIDFELYPPVKEAVVEKQKQEITVKKLTASFKESALKKAAKTFQIGAKASGKLTCKKLSGSAKLTITKAGKVKVKKGTTKGTYKIKISITAAETDSYLPRTIKKNIKVVVK